jgi:hypothetical protein
MKAARPAMKNSFGSRSASRNWIAKMISAAPSSVAAWSR